MRAHALLGAVVIMFGVSAAQAADAEWRVGLAQIKITPEKPVFMAGYASRTKPFDKVVADLFVKALVLEDRDGQRALLVTSDVIGFHAAIAEPMCQRISEKLGIKREQILISSAHIHTGPLLSLDPTLHNGMTAGDAQRTIEYTKQLQDKVVEVTTRAAAKLEPGQRGWPEVTRHVRIR